MKFITEHKANSHLAIIDGKTFGPFNTEIDLVRAIPVNLKQCNCIATETIGNGRFPDLTHTWETIPVKHFEIREGDGNEGCYRRGTIEASNAFEALRKASRTGMIHKTRDVTLRSMDGDDEHAYLASYVSPIYGDACRWCAEANLVEGSE